MNKVKIALTLLSIVIAVGPLAGVLLVYQNNLIGLVIPPEIKNLGSSSSDVNSAGTQFLSGSQFQLPTLAGEPQYNQQTGAYSYPINFTNPLTTEISVDQMSAEIKFKDNNALLGNISILQPIHVAPGESGIINATGILDPTTVNQLEGAYSSGELNNVVLENVNVVVGGVTMHFDRLDAGSLQGLGG